MMTRLEPAPICDVAAWLGPYPFRHLRECSLDDLVARCDRLGIGRVVASGYDNLFAQNGLETWRIWREAIAAHPAETRIDYWPVVNPAAPGELRRFSEYAAVHRPRGIRLLPNYHGYRLWEPAVADVMAVARQMDLVVQVFVRIADERWHWMLHTSAVDVNQDIAYLTSQFQEQPLVISGASAGEIGFLGRRMRQQRMLYADLSRVRGPIFALDRIDQAAPVDRLLFGSLWPVQIIEASLWEITTSTLDAGIQRAILGGNYAALMAGRGSGQAPDQPAAGGLDAGPAPAVAAGRAGSTCTV
jgi:predicted TIM-barrel fold metal-dependent hydrolase